MSPSKLYSRILPYVNGCPEPMVDQAIVDACTEFAEQSQVLFSVEYPIPLVDGRSTYYIYPDGSVEVDLIRHVTCGSRELIPVSSTSALNDQLPTWGTTKSSEPTHYSTFGEAGSLTVYPEPLNSSGQSLVVVASWSPSFDAKSIPDELVTKYALGVIEGVKAKLMLMPDKKWTNIQLSAICQGKFDAAINEARARAIHGKAAGTITVRPRRFGS